MANRVETSYCDDGHDPILVFHIHPDDDPMCPLCRQFQRIEILKTELADKAENIHSLRGELDEMRFELENQQARNQPEELT